MTDYIRDMPTVTADHQTDLPPSDAWFSEQGRRFLDAQIVVQQIGIVPDALRAYRQELTDEADTAVCDMALDVVKSVRGCSRFKRYGADTDLYTLEVKKLACERLGARAASAFSRAQPLE